MYGTKLAQMPNDLPMGLGERLPRAEEVRKEKAERDAADKATWRMTFFEQADQTFNHELAKLQSDEIIRRQADARRAEEAQQKVKESPSTTSEILNGFNQTQHSYNVAGGRALNLRDLVNSFAEKKGSFVHWTPSLLIEFEQFAGQLGAEEAAARARSPVEGAPKESDWVDIDF